MNNLQVFKSEEFGEVRSLLINNKPWFIQNRFKKMKRRTLDD